MRRLTLDRLRMFFVFVVLSQALASQAAFAQGYVTTNQNGAQTQIDINHSSTIYLVVSGSTVSFGGGNITIKKGSQSSADVLFTLYPDTTCSGMPLDTVTLGPGSISGSFTPTIFQIPGNRSLSAGNYCTTVTPTADDQ